MGPSPQRNGEKIAGIFRNRDSFGPSDIDRTEQEANSPRGSNERDVSVEKSDTRHVLRPKRGEERKARDDDSEDERRRERKEKERREEERARRRRQEEEEEAEEEERRK